MKKILLLVLSLLVSDQVFAESLSGFIGFYFCSKDHKSYMAAWDNNFGTEGGCSYFQFDQKTLDKKCWKTPDKCIAPIIIGDTYKDNTVVGYAELNLNTMKILNFIQLADTQGFTISVDHEENKLVVTPP